MSTAAYRSALFLKHGKNSFERTIQTRSVTAKNKPISPSDSEEDDTRKEEDTRTEDDVLGEESIKSAVEALKEDYTPPRAVEPIKEAEEPSHESGLDEMLRQFKADQQNKWDTHLHANKLVNDKHDAAIQDLQEKINELFETLHHTHTDASRIHIRSKKKKRLVIAHQVKENSASEEEEIPAEAVEKPAAAPVAAAAKPKAPAASAKPKAPAAAPAKPKAPAASQAKTKAPVEPRQSLPRKAKSVPHLSAGFEYHHSSDSESNNTSSTNDNNSSEIEDSGNKEIEDSDVAIEIYDIEIDDKEIDDSEIDDKEIDDKEIDDKESADNEINKDAIIDVKYVEFKQQAAARDAEMLSFIKQKSEILIADHVSLGGREYIEKIEEDERDAPILNLELKRPPTTGQWKLHDYNSFIDEDNGYHVTIHRNIIFLTGLETATHEIMNQYDIKWYLPESDLKYPSESDYADETDRHPEVIRFLIRLYDCVSAYASQRGVSPELIYIEGLNNIDRLEDLKCCNR